MNHAARGSIADQAPVARRAGVPARTKSTAARKDVHGLTTDETQGSSLPVVARNLEATDGSPVAPTQTAGTQAPPVDTNSRAKATRAKPPARPKAGADRVASRPKAGGGRKPPAATIEQLRQRGDIIPADKVGRGRPKLHADRKAYKAQKERERRAKLKTEAK